MTTLSIIPALMASACSIYLGIWFYGEARKSFGTVAARRACAIASAILTVALVGAIWA